MKNQLIADAGSTKIDWTYTGPGGTLRRFQTEGLNALLATADQMTRLFGAVREALSDIPIDRIHYYGAGCASPAICDKVRDILQEALGATDVSVGSDLLGAARALLGHRPGVACILGTGSNSCLYDGRDITMNIPPMGFILGDEGSGAVLGKRLAGDVSKSIAPEHIRTRFKTRFGLTVTDLLDHVYRQSAPNRFLASLVPFISENINDPYMHGLGSDEFSRFFNRNVLRYPGARDIPVNFTGSIAVVFEDILKEAAGRAQLSVGTIMGAPMPGLITYHTDHTD